jgi:two-component system, chemotaxis family, chemotaxis protein CheY
MSLDLSMAVLVVDDFATMTRIIDTLLQRIGITNIEHARDGRAALKSLRKKNFSLVISDLNMTPMSGLDLLEEVRRDPVLKAVRFVLISAEANPQLMRIALDEERERFLAKPFTADVLRKTIEELFRKPEN